MYRIIKRLFCIIASFLAIVITLPIWIITIIGIEVSDLGPVFYMAERVGKNNDIFKMFKFRSMRVDKKANENSFKADTNRIFPFGRFIRASKIDELPQLLNCLMGDMAIIGPRPASVDQVQITRGGKNQIVSKLTPGLSGPSALYDYIYGDSIEDENDYENLVLPTRLALDRYYIDNSSCVFDLKMIWWTIVCILNTVLKREDRSSKILNELKSYVE